MLLIHFWKPSIRQEKKKKTSKLSEATWKWQNIHSKQFFIARNKKHKTACTYIQNTNYRQTDAEHVVMFFSVKPTPSKKDHTLLYNTVSYRESAVIFNMKQWRVQITHFYRVTANYATYISIFNWTVIKIQFLLQCVLWSVGILSDLLHWNIIKVKAIV